MNLSLKLDRVRRTEAFCVGIVVGSIIPCVVSVLLTVLVR